jgi:hypothetical protein
MIDDAIVSDLVQFCKKGCSEIFIKQPVFEESSKCSIPANIHSSQSVPLLVAGELLNVS